MKEEYIKNLTSLSDKTFYSNQLFSETSSTNLFFFTIKREINHECEYTLFAIQNNRVKILVKTKNLQSFIKIVNKNHLRAKYKQNKYISDINNHYVVYLNKETCKLYFVNLYTNNTKILSNNILHLIHASKIKKNNSIRVSLLDNQDVIIQINNQIYYIDIINNEPVVYDLPSLSNDTVLGNNGIFAIKSTDTHNNIILYNYNSGKCLTYKINFYTYDFDHIKKIFFNKELSTVTLSCEIYYKYTILINNVFFYDISDNLYAPILQNNTD